MKKLFVGSLRDDFTEDDLKEYFSQFGDVTSVALVVEKETGKKRGFGFVEYDDYDPVDKACCKFLCLRYWKYFSTLSIVSLL